MTAVGNCLCRETGITVAGLAWEYLGSMKETMKPSTYVMYENYTVNEIIPKIGGNCRSRL